MQKQTIRSQKMQNGKWQPAILPLQGPVVFSEPTDFEIYFDTKEEADRHALEYLKTQGVKEENIEIK